MTQNTQGLEWLAGGGGMGRDIRAMDWSQTPLGPIEAWPQSLRTTVSLCLASTFPILIAWGAQRMQIYNDGYWPICGAKHPRVHGPGLQRVLGLGAGPRSGAAFERACTGGTVVPREPADVPGPATATWRRPSSPSPSAPSATSRAAWAACSTPSPRRPTKMLSERRTRLLRDARRPRWARPQHGRRPVAARRRGARDDVARSALRAALPARGGRHARPGWRRRGPAPGQRAPAPSEMELDVRPRAPSGRWHGRVRVGPRRGVDDLGARFGPRARAGPTRSRCSRRWCFPITVAGLARARRASLVAGVSPRLRAGRRVPRASSRSSRPRVTAGDRQRAGVRGRSASGPRRWPSSTAPRRPSSRNVSATSSARRSR